MKRRLHYVNVEVKFEVMATDKLDASTKAIQFVHAAKESGAKLGVEAKEIEITRCVERETGDEVLARLNGPADDLVSREWIASFARPIGGGRYVLDRLSSNYFIEFRCDGEGCGMLLCEPGNEELKVWIEPALTSRRVVAELCQALIAMGDREPAVPDALASV